MIVNALKSSPWATFTLGLHHSHRASSRCVFAFRPARPRAGSLAHGCGTGVVCGVRPAGGSRTRDVGPRLQLSGLALTFAIIVYGFAASALPVWLLLAPRDYLSAFVKAGAIFALAAGILLVRPHPDAAADPLCRWQWPGIRRENFPVLLHHHCLRRHQRLSFPDFQRHHAKNDSA